MSKNVKNFYFFLFVLREILGNGIDENKVSVYNNDVVFETMLKSKQNFMRLIERETFPGEKKHRIISGMQEGKE